MSIGVKWSCKRKRNQYSQENDVLSRSKQAHGHNIGIQNGNLEESRTPVPDSNSLPLTTFQLNDNKRSHSSSCLLNYSRKSEDSSQFDREYVDELISFQQLFKHRDECVETMEDILYRSMRFSLHHLNVRSHACVSSAYSWLTVPCRIFVHVR